MELIEREIFSASCFEVMLCCFIHLESIVSAKDNPIAVEKMKSFQCFLVTIKLKCILNCRVITIWSLCRSDVKQSKKIWLKVSATNELAH